MHGFFKVPTWRVLQPRLIPRFSRPIGISCTLLAVFFGFVVALASPLPTSPMVSTFASIQAQSTPTVSLADAQSAQVTRIVDGDTIHVLLNGTDQTVRYIGIDTPERGQPGYKAATEANRALVEEQTVYLLKETSETDRDGRLLRQVYLTDGRWVNGELVVQGWAQPVRYAPDTLKAQELEAWARKAAQAKQGFWSGTSAYDGAMSYALTLRTSNVRKGPGTNFAISGSALANTPLTLFGRNQAGDWVQVRLPDRSGGWMNVSLLKVNVAVTSIPIVQDAAQSPTVVQPTPTATSSSPAAPTEATPTAPQTPMQSNNGNNEGGSKPFQCTGGCSVAPDPSCAIKGNVNSKKDKIYHMPGWRDYKRTNINPNEGDRWFCTEEEALAAGFRAPLNH
ncbi:MAG: thermonuclease family protein [Caldilineaceae bacterium]